MNLAHTVLILAMAFLAVFWQAAFQGVRHLFGAQIDLLPPLMLYAALHASLPVVTLTALLGGLWFDSLSANPLGITVLPLFVVGLSAYAARDLILREQTFAQAILGLAACTLSPILTLLVLLTLGYNPLVGWGTLWQLLVMSVGGAIVTPVLFEVFGWLERTLTHSRPVQSSFRPDREIRRGR
jgi:rod shape-determining protein MreD